MPRDEQAPPQHTALWGRASEGQGGGGEGQGEAPLSWSAYCRLHFHPFILKILTWGGAQASGKDMTWEVPRRYGPASSHPRPPALMFLLLLLTLSIPRVHGSLGYDTVGTPGLPPKSETLGLSLGPGTQGWGSKGG